MLSIRIKKILGASILFCCLMVTFFAAPIGYLGLQKVEAETVHIASDSSSTGIGTLIESAYSAAEESVQTYFSSWDNFKESVLDPLMWRMANAVLSNMLTSLTQWVNNGFEGSPAFVTDIEGFLTNAADEAVGGFLQGEGLGLLCSPFKIDVIAALNISYYQGRSHEAQCKISDMVDNVENFLDGTFTDGGWGGWFELTISPHSDPNRAYLEGLAYMSSLTRSTRDREFGILKMNSGFLDVKICEEVETGSPGHREKKCNTTTPGHVVQSQLNKTLGLPADRLVVADEFDELVGALFAQVANQAIMGANGLLGLGGSSYSSNNYGSGGNSSYLDALAEEGSIQNLNKDTEPIAVSIEEQYEYIDLQELIISMVNRVESNIEAAKTEYGTCFNVRMTSTLTNARDDAEYNIVLAEEMITVLSLLDYELYSAQTNKEQLDIMLEFNTLISDGLVMTKTDIYRSEIYIDYRLPRKISELNKSINSRETHCENVRGQGDNDY